MPPHPRGGGASNYEITEFETAMAFISDYKAVYDIVFLDIEMPLIDGMSAAKKLRLLDTEINIIFITKMPKYAIEGYEVDAIGFMVKPVKYFDFIDKLKKAIKITAANKTESIIVKTDGDYMKIPTREVYYVTKDKNDLVYCTSRGEFRRRGTMESAEEELKKLGFSMCNSGTMVNLRLITQVTATDVIINGERLPIAFRRAKQFKTDMLAFLKAGK